MKTFKKLAIVGILALFTACGGVKQTSTAAGTSFETAIVAKSIKAEYVYVREHCDSCSVKSQALSYYKDKPYDILYVVKPDGEEVAYYFDISSFFGKGF